MGWQNLVYDVKRGERQQYHLALNCLIRGRFPGNVVATVTYTLTDNNAIDIVWKATTDKKTVINMTNHSYFNLNGDHSIPITNHILTLNADNFTPCDETYTTTGEILPVAGTPMISPKVRRLVKINNYDYAQLKNGNGYDHNWVLNTRCDNCAAKLCALITGIFVEVYTNEPIQFYSATSWTERESISRDVRWNSAQAAVWRPKSTPTAPISLIFPDGTVQYLSRDRSTTAAAFTNLALNKITINQTIL